jgi:hypothetical protein
MVFNYSEQKQTAIRLLDEAWRKREEQIAKEKLEYEKRYEDRIRLLEDELNRAKQYITHLEQERAEFIDQIQDLTSANSKLELIRSNIMSTLRDCDSSTTIASPRSSSKSSRLVKTDKQEKIIDGKKFFREARSRLSYEVFSRFLASVKRLNEGNVSKDRVISEVEDLLKDEHRDLFEDFVTLLVKKE